eukprot:TRINITY_DN8690_c0_g1_i2.p1 TRINITY_DN8690_c0_g1~~TRINITY_DN8690_c0_g1_i2.p1  ORF type:complete len:514 (-),score=98.52 TRINITY_DN8690_c0_g1_i2:18-1559(-)
MSEREDSSLLASAAPPPSSEPPEKAIPSDSAPKSEELGVSLARLPPLPVTQKLAFGAGAFGPGALLIIRGLFTTPFLLDVAEISPALAGTILLVSKFWDAVNDPIMGFCSDHFPTRWGRRKPWLVVGVVPLAVVWLALWIVPGEPGGNLLPLYYLVLLLLYETFATACVVPHNAMLPELAGSYDEATSLSQYRYMAYTIGQTAGSMSVSLIVASMENEERAYFISALLWAILLFPGILMTVLVVRERSPLTKISGAQLTTLGHALSTFWQGIKDAASCRPFVLVALVYTSHNFCVEFFNSNMVLYLKYVLEIDLSALFYILMVQNIFRIVGIPFWAHVSYRFDKRIGFLCGFFFMMIVQSGFWFLGKSDLSWFYVLAACRGFAGSAVVLPYSCISDVVDYDELENGKRRPAVFSSFVVFFQKLCVSAALALSNFALEAVGYVPHNDGSGEDQQPEDVRLALRLMVSWIPAAILLSGVVAGLAYPLSKARHSEVLSQLAARQRGSLRRFDKQLS